MRASDLPNLVDDHGLHAAPSRFDRAILLRLVPDPWPFADLAVEPPRLVQAPDLLELALEGQKPDLCARSAAGWDTEGDWSPVSLLFAVISPGSARRTAKPNSN